MEQAEGREDLAHHGWVLHRGEEAARRAMAENAFYVIYAPTGGTYVYGSYLGLDGLFQEEAAELDRKRREAILHRMQRVVQDKVIYAPIWDLAFLNGVGPRVQESGPGLISGHAYSAPYEDVTLMGKEPASGSGWDSSGRAGRLPKSVVSCPPGARPRST